MMDSSWHFYTYTQRISIRFLCFLCFVPSYFTNPLLPHFPTQHLYPLKVRLFRASTVQKTLIFWRSLSPKAENEHCIGSVSDSRAPCPRFKFCPASTALGPYAHFRPMFHCLHCILGNFPTQNIIRRIEGVKLFAGSLLPNKHSVMITTYQTKLSARLGEKRPCDTLCFIHFASDKLPQSQLAFWKTFVRLSWGWGGKATWLVSLKALYLLTLKGFSLVSRYNIPSTCFKTSNRDLLGLHFSTKGLPVHFFFELLRDVVLWGLGPVLWEQRMSGLNVLIRGADIQAKKSVWKLFSKQWPSLTHSYRTPVDKVPPIELTIKMQRQ